MSILTYWKRAVHPVTAHTLCNLSRLAIFVISHFGFEGMISLLPGLYQFLAIALYFVSCVLIVSVNELRK